MFLDSNAGAALPGPRARQDDIRVFRPMAASLFRRLSRPLARFAFVAAAAATLAGCGVNSIPTAEENAKAKWADVQNQYQRRADLIPNLVATVKGYAKQEQDTLTKVTEARAKATSVQVSADDLTDPQDGRVPAGAGRAVAGAGPPDGERGSLSRPQVQRELPGAAKPAGRHREPHLRGAARYEAVREYNTTIRTFPAVIGAKVIYGAKPMVPFEATTPGAQEAPKVNFN
jgi:LemA protein